MDIIISRDERSLRQWVLERAGRCISRRENAILLVPSQMTFLMEKRLLENSPRHSFYSLEVLSFEKLTDKILKSAGGAARPTLSKTGAYMLAKKALVELRGKTVFDDRRDSTLHQKLADMVKSLKMEAISAEDIEAFSETAPPLLKDKLAGIAAVYRGMQTLSPDMMDSADAEALAAQRAGDAEFLRGITLIVHGFDYLPIRRRNMLSALIKAAGKVYMTFEADPQDELFALTNSNLVDVEAMAKGAGRIPKRSVLPDASLNDGIRRAAEEIFSFGRCVPASTKDVYVYSAADKRAEAENAARIALDLCVNKGLRARDITVLAAVSSDYASYIADAFTKAGLPYYIDGKRSLSTAPIASAILSALSLAANSRWRIADALALIKSGMTALSEDEAEALTCYARSHGLYGSAMKNGIKDSEEMEALRLRAFGPVIALGKGEGPLHERLIKYLEESHAKEREAEISEEMAALGRAGDARFHAQVYERVTDIIHASAGISKLGPEEYRDILSTAFADASIAIVPPLTDQVTVTDILHATPADIKVAIVVGVNEGVLPVPASMGGLITEEENALLRSALVSFPAGLSLSDQKCRLRRAFSSADTLILSYNDNDGPPSRIVRRALEIFDTSALPAITRINTPSGGMGHLARELRALKTGASDIPRLLPMYMEHAPEKAARMLAALSEDGSARSIGEQMAEAVYGPKRASVSQLQDFHSCAFKNFVNRGLRPQEIEELSERPVDTGNYAHALLDGLFRTLKKRGLSWRDASDETIAQIIDGEALSCMQTHNNGIFLSGKRHEYTESVIRREVYLAAQAVRSQLKEASADVYATEKKFTDLTLSEGSGAIRLRGVIDRIDIARGEDENLIRIVDYKTSLRKFSLKDFYMGVNIQLVIYMIAAVSIMKNEGMEAFPAGGFYFTVSMPYADSEDERYKNYTMHGLMLAETSAAEQFDSFSGSKLKHHSVRMSEESSFGAYTREEIELMMDYAARLTEQAAARIYSGDITIKPCQTGTALACSHCDFASICRFRSESGEKRYAPRVDRDGIMTLMKGDKNA